MANNNNTQKPEDSSSVELGLPITPLITVVSTQKNPTVSSSKNSTENSKGGQSSNNSN